MSVTLADVRLARKRAYDRVRYELEKEYGKGLVNVGKAGYELPKINPHATQAELDYWYEYFGQLRRGNVSEYIELKYEPQNADKPTGVKNPYGRVKRLEEVDKYVETGHLPDRYYEDTELRDAIWEVDLEREQQFEQTEEPEPPEPEPPEPDDWYDYDDYDFGDEDDTAPNYQDNYQQTIDDAYEYGEKIGAAIEEALENIGNVTQLSEEKMGAHLKDLGDIWEDIADAYRYFAQSSAGGYATSNGKSPEENAREKNNGFYGGMEMLNKALTKLYGRFGLTYIKEW